MFSIEMRINGILIAHINGRNIYNTENDDCLYYYDLYEVKEGEGRVEKGSILHQQNEGILVLINKILSKEIKRRKKDEKTM